MAFQARRRMTPPARWHEIFDLYLARHDRINTWDLVDRAAPHVVGDHLADKPRDPFYRLASSPQPCDMPSSISMTMPARTTWGAARCS